MKSEDCWVPPGQAAVVRGQRMADGMLYVGSRLPSVNWEHLVEPALIDPHLPVAEGVSDYEGSNMQYWPSYSVIPPSSRRAYLDWLGSGRSDPNACIGYVFLFLYGLERRVLFDFERLPAVKSELPAIIAELERLLAIYQGNRSFKRYASQLLDVARIRADVDIQPSHVRAASATGGSLPGLLRVVVGRFAERGQRLPVEWALAWVNCDPEMPVRTPGRRCSREFQTLFAARYAALHGEGLALKVCKRHVVIDYQPASASFGRLSVSSPVPDAASLVGPQRALASLVTDCCDALEPLSRLRGKESVEPSALQLASVLPAELLSSHAPPELASLRRALEQVLEDRDVAVARAVDMFGAWTPAADASPTKASTVALLRAVQRVGFAIEPDVRFGGPPIGPNDQIAVFRGTESDPAAPSATYSSASLFLHLGVCVAQADGSIADAELRHLQEHLGSALYLSEAERHRLQAHTAWLTASPPSTGRLKKRIETLDESQRLAAGRFLVSLTLADGQIDPSEVKNLVKIFQLLGLDPGSVHEAIHAAQSGVASTELAHIPAREPAATDFAIPSPPERTVVPAAAGEVGVRPLDMAAVEAKMRESAQIAVLLGEILAPEDEVEPTVQRARMDDADCVRSLDQKHSRLLRLMGDQPSWSREEYEQLAADVSLLPDGALEVLNELAFEVCNAPLIEGDDPIELDRSVYEEILK